MRVLGVSAHHHDSSACLVVDGRVEAAVSEERLSRQKGDPRSPVRAATALLTERGLDLSDIDLLAFHEDPDALHDRRVAVARASGLGPPSRRDPIGQLRRDIGWDGPVWTGQHHRSHAVAAWWTGGFRPAAIAVVDGVGEVQSTTIWEADPAREPDARLDLRDQAVLPDSLGLLYAAVTAYLGFAVNGGEHKVMGLAAHGSPRFADALRAHVVDLSGEGLPHVRPGWVLLSGGHPATPALQRLLGGGPRQATGPLTRRHRDVAASIQIVLEEAMLAVAHRAAALTGRTDLLCLGGGVALNAVAVGRIAREGPFAEVLVQPAAGDAGSSVGAALDAVGALGVAQRTTRLGPGLPEGQAERLHAALGARGPTFTDDAWGLADHVAARLARGQVVGWCRGRAEFGPRALGGRSMLADPRAASTRDRINAQIKGRELFRPLAPMVLADRAHDLLDVDRPSPFMTSTWAVREGAGITGVTHVDGSTRPQTVDPARLPDVAALLAAANHHLGVPAVLNTSLNRAGEPIVGDAVDGLRCAVAAGLDALVLDDVVIDLAKLDASARAALTRWAQAPASAADHSRPRGYDVA